MTKKGIHGNEDCERCGACCTYFKIFNNDGSLFKEADTPCEHLSYDIETRKAICGIYEDLDKPTLCSEFECSNLEEENWGIKHRKGLLKLVN